MNLAQDVLYVLGGQRGVSECRLRKTELQHGFAEPGHADPGESGELTDPQVPCRQHGLADAATTSDCNQGITQWNNQHGPK